MRDTFLITQPWITEKSTILNEGGKYVFKVKSGATKNEIKKAVHDLYKVDVISVNVVNTAEKMKNYRGRKSERSGFKKAIVTLKSGQKIDLAR